MRKLAGTDVIILIKTAIKDEVVLKEASALTRKDFSNDDLIVNCFYKMCPEGFSSEIFNNKTASNKVLNSLETVKKEIINVGVRKAFNYLQNVRNASNNAVILENHLNSIEHKSAAEFLTKAANLISFLSKYVDGEKNKQALASSCKKVMYGELEDASKNLHEIYARTNPTQNIKTAFVTIKQQIGEGYQMCPKGIYQSGRPIPMAISNCREYCIDARLNPDGTVGCNYLKWLQDHVITQEQALNLFDKMPVEQTTVNLKPGQRTKFPMSDQDSQDMRVTREEALTEKITTKPWEEQLEEAHKKNNTEKKEKPTVLATDEALEKMLKTMTDVFDEDDLDTLEEQLREAMGE
jgi:hypothetical protein